MKILGFEIPKGQRLWFWNAGSEAGTLLAKDYDEAYAKAIAARLGGAESFLPDPTDPTELANQRRWFAKNDTLEEVVGEYTGPAYAGDLPDED